MEHRSGLLTFVRLFTVLAVLSAATELHALDASCAEPSETPADPNATTCGNGHTTCHWIVAECDGWYEDDCTKIGPVLTDTKLTKVSWERFYCTCDTKCYVREYFFSCTDDYMLIKYFCEKEHGEQSCPADRACFWQGEDTLNASNNHNCGKEGCCGGFCMFHQCGEK